MSNADVIRDQYAAVNERDWERAMSHYAEDVELVIPAGGIRSGTFSGRDEVGRWFGDWFSSFGRDLHFEILRLEELPDGSIEVTAENVATGKASGAEVRATVAWRYGFRDGRISHVEGGDRQGSAEAATSESAGSARAAASPTASRLSTHTLSSVSSGVCQ